MWPLMSSLERGPEWVKLIANYTGISATFNYNVSNKMVVAVLDPGESHNYFSLVFDSTSGLLVATVTDYPKVS